MALQCEPLVWKERAQSKFGLYHFEIKRKDSSKQINKSHKTKRFTMKKAIIIILGIFLPIFLIGSVLGNTRPNLIKMDTNILRNLSHAPSQMIQQEWISYLNSWHNEVKITFEYSRIDIEVPQIDHMVYFEYHDGEWLEMFRAYADYNAHGYITHLYAQMEIAPGEYMNIVEINVEYNSQNHLTTFEGYQMGDDGLELNYTIDIQYNNWHDMIIYQYICYPEDEWEADLKQTFELDNQNRIASITIYYAEPGTQDWFLGDKIDTIYRPEDTSSSVDFIEYMSKMMPILYLFGDDTSSFGMVDEELWSYWEDNTWIPYEKYVHEYNSLLQNTEKTEYYPSYPSWEQCYRELMTYDDHGNLTQITGEDYRYDNWFPEFRVMLSYIPWSDVSDELMPAIDKVSLQAYPQPFRDEVNLIAESKAGGAITIDIFNLKGQHVRSFDAASGQNVIWDGKDAHGKTLPASVYLMRANQDGISTNKKLIKLK